MIIERGYRLLLQQPFPQKYPFPPLKIGKILVQILVLFPISLYAINSSYKLLDVLMQIDSIIN